MRSGSVAKATGSTFSATSRCSFVSRARQTSPIPPAPSGAVTSYGPTRVPGLSATVLLYSASPRLVKGVRLCRRVIVRWCMR